MNVSSELCVSRISSIYHIHSYFLISFPQPNLFMSLFSLHVVFKGKLVAVSPVYDRLFAYRMHYVVLDLFVDTLDLITQYETNTILVKVFNAEKKLETMDLDQFHYVMGQYECVTHELLVDEDGYILPANDFGFLQAFECTQSIFSEICLESA